MVQPKPQCAGFVRRCMAVLIDFSLLILVTTIITLLLPNLPWWSREAGWTLKEYELTGYWVQLAVVAVMLFCWVRLQGTPGKLLMNCRIIDIKTGIRPSFGTAVIRCLGYLVSAVPLFLGFFWILWDRRRQGFHDKLAGTLVVMDDESEKSLQQLAKELS